jgi:fructuronate reductase
VAETTGQAIGHADSTGDLAAADGSQKLPVRILGTVADRLAAGAGVELALVVAAWVACVLGPRSGELGVRDAELERLLGLDAVFGPLGRMPAFAGAARRHAASLWRGDVHAVAAAAHGASPR